MRCCCSQVASHQPALDGSLQSGGVPDMEDFGMPRRPLQPAILISTKRKRVSQGDGSQVESQELELTQSWREILGPPPPMGTTRVRPELLLPVGTLHLSLLFTKIPAYQMLRMEHLVSSREVSSTSYLADGFSKASFVGSESRVSQHFGNNWG